MIKKVKPKIDFVKLEHRILDFWEKNDIFEKRVKANKGKPKWSFIDGPITANNPMGVHHAWGRTLKDVYNRFKGMQGHELRYQNGFDCQGLWVEVEVEKELGFKTKKDIEEFGIEKFVNLCKERVEKYSKVQTEQSIRLGYWMDWDNSYYTMSDENNYTIWTFLKKLFEDGKIYRGNDSVPWSGRSGTSYSQMEIIEGRKLVAHKAVFVQFPIKNRENEYLLVWTTTPWTLTSNVAVGINSSLEYAKVKASDGSIYFLADENLEFQRLDKQFKDKKQWVEGVPKLKTLSQIFKERGGYEILETVKGSELVDMEYSGPFDDLEAQSEPGGWPFVNDDLGDVVAVNQHRVIDPGKDNIGNDIVVAGEGTGLVHMAPGCGDIDHKIGKKFGFVNLAPLDEESKFIEKFGWLTGKLATDPETTDAIIADLKERGFLMHVEEYPHVYPHCWRSGDELVFRLVEEWYINMDWRGEIKKVVDQIDWMPDWGRDREQEWLDNMGDWMISKKRFWGLALPIWTFEDESFYVVGSKKELKELAVEGWEEFEGNSPHRPWIDKVKIKHPESGLVGTRIKDVGNPWLDAGIVPFSTLNYLSDKEYWKEWFPGDFVTECFPGQFRNWFYSLLAMSALLEKSPPFKTLLGHALVKDEHGKEMHKSAGNAIWFDDAAEKMGVDVMRWMYIRQNVEKNLLFGYHTADDVRKKLLTLWNSYSFFCTYANVDGFDPDNGNLDECELTLLDKWILSKLNVLVRDSEAYLEGFKHDNYLKAVDAFVEDLSNWYIRRNRRRFWKTEDDSDKHAAYHTLYEVLLSLSKLLAPAIPFLSEELYSNLISGRKQFPESVHLCDFPKSNSDYIDEVLMTEVSSLKKAVELGRSARNQSSIKIRQPLKSLVFHVDDENVSEFLKAHCDVIMEELNVKSVEQTTDSADLISWNLKPNLPVLGQKFGKELNAVRKELESADPSEVLAAIENKNEYVVIVGGENVALKREDILTEFKSEEGYASASDGGITVGLTTELNESLIQEGIVRDVIRQVQIMRKNANFQVEDRINIYGKVDGEVGASIETFKNYFLSETLTKKFENEFKSGEYEESFSIRGQEMIFGIERVQN